MHGEGNVPLAAQTWSLPESSTDAELKGGSEMAFSITMINIFSLVRAFSPPVSYFEASLYQRTAADQVLSSPAGRWLSGSTSFHRDPVRLNSLYANRQMVRVKMPDFGRISPQKKALKLRSDIKMSSSH